MTIGLSAEAWPTPCSRRKLTVASRICRKNRDSSSAPEDAPQVDFATLVAQSDPAQGEKVFKQCKSCHNADEEKNGTGPYLVDVVGRKMDSVDGYAYSGALPADETWTLDNLDHWLESPKDFAPGTKMTFKGLGKVQDRAAVVAYLVSKSPDFQMPEPSAAPAATDTPQEAAADTANAASEAATSAASEGEAPAAAGTESPGEAAAVATDAAATSGDSEIAKAYASADIDAGAKVFKKCQACHVADKPQNKVGPELMKILDRPIGSAPDYAYSGALPEGTWTLENLDHWLTDPKGFAPGTKMSFAGLKKVEDRANVIAYIESVSN